MFHSFTLKECLVPALPVIFHGLSDTGGFNPTSVRRQLCGTGLRQGVVCICQFIFSCSSLANLIMDPKHPKKEGSALLPLAMYSGVKVVPGSNSSWPKLPT